jgi:hypothetical protein
MRGCLSKGRQKLSGSARSADHCWVNDPKYALVPSGVKNHEGKSGEPPCSPRAPGSAGLHGVVASAVKAVLMTTGQITWGG